MIVFIVDVFSYTFMVWALFQNGMALQILAVWALHAIWKELDRKYRQAVYMRKVNEAIAAKIVKALEEEKK